MEVLSKLFFKQSYEFLVVLNAVLYRIVTSIHDTREIAIDGWEKSSRLVS